MEATPDLPQKFSVASDFLTDFVAALPNPASVKDVKTGRYILGNDAMLKLYGLKNVENMTVQELAGQVKTSWMPSCTNAIETLDKQIQHEKKTVKTNNYTLLNTEGLVNIAEVTKMPVLDYQQKMIAILTFDRNLTETVSWDHLYHLYKDFYPDIPVAIHYFLKFLCIKHYFTQPISEAELLVLMSLKQRYSQKYAAQKLEIPLETVALHTYNIQKKLQNRNLQTLLEDLRNEPIYHPIN